MGFRYLGDRVAEFTCRVCGALFVSSIPSAGKHSATFRHEAGCRFADIINAAHGRGHLTAAERQELDCIAGPAKSAVRIVTEVHEAES